MENTSFLAIKGAQKPNSTMKRDKLSSRESSKKSCKILVQDIINSLHSLANTTDRFTTKFAKENVVKMVGGN